MPIQRFLDINLQSEAVCAFLKDHDLQTYDAKFEPVDHFEDTGERKAMPYSEPAPPEIRLHTAIIKDYKVYDRTTFMQVTTGRTLTRVDHRLNLDAYALLLVKSGTSDEHRTAIQEAFATYQPGMDDVDSVESALVQQGVSMGSYQVLLSFKLTRLSSPIQETAHDDAFLAIARNSEQHDVREANRFETCEVPDLDLDATGRVVSVTDPNNPNDGLAQIAGMLEAETDCNDLEYTERMIGTLLQYPEWKVEWVMRDVKIGPCRIMRTKLPELQTRTTRKVLYAFVLSPSEAKKLLERVFINCMETSAVVAGLLLLVTGGYFPTALAAFKLTMAECLKNKVPDAIKRCLISELAIVTDQGDWTPV